MAEVSCFQIHELEENPVPYWSSFNEFDFDISSDLEFDADYDNADVIFTGCLHDVVSDLNQVASTMNRSGEDLDLNLGLGLDEEEEDEDDYYFERRKGFASASGDATSTVEPTCIGTVGFDFDSDDDENGVIELDLRSEREHGDGDEIEVSLRWDSLRLEARNADFEWEEVDERGDEVFGMFVDPDNEDDEEGPVALSAALAVTNEEVEVSVQRAEAEPNVEWEVLLNSSNWEPNSEADHEAVAAEHFRDGGSDDYIFTAEYDMLFGQFSENEGAGMGRPPAAKFVVETLPSVVVTLEDVEEGDVVCAVCKEDISFGEQGKRLPCGHRYHGECIVPWLKIRNTCPVCRFELPTDDVAYERRKSQRTSDGLNFLPI